MSETIKRPFYLLPLLVVSQLAGTSLWFAGNAVIRDLEKTIPFKAYGEGPLLASVQLGFITGTFVFAFLALADRIKPSLLFFLSAIMGAFANAAIAWWARDISTVVFLRAGTGFFLAGIYPVGMKIAADWYEGSLGKALGYLVGALVLGTAFPYFLQLFNYDGNWKAVLYTISIFCASGGLLVLLLIGDGPFRHSVQRFRPKQIFTLFAIPRFRSAAFGYFGHMWELYAFWGFIPALVQLHNEMTGDLISSPMITVVALLLGAIGCIFGGYRSQKKGSARFALSMLIVSGLCSGLSFLTIGSTDGVFLLWLCLWAFTVIPDSPQLSSIIAISAPPQLRGTALTISTCIGFSITIGSINLIRWGVRFLEPKQDVFTWLAIGPVIGIVALISFLRSYRINKNSATPS